MADTVTVRIEGHPAAVWRLVRSLVAGMLRQPAHPSVGRGDDAEAPSTFFFDNFVADGGVVRPDAFEFIAGLLAGRAPSAGMVQTSRCPDRLETKTTSCPSADQRG